MTCNASLAPARCSTSKARAGLRNPWPSPTPRSRRRGERAAKKSYVTSSSEYGRLEDKLRNQEASKRRRADPQRKETAYHEAGHAVIGLAVQLPVALAVSVPIGRSRVGHVQMVHQKTYSIGPRFRLVGDKYKKTVPPKAAELDAFGNEPRKVEWTPEQHRAEIVMCFAGPMARRGYVTEMAMTDLGQILASSSDMGIARHHRGELGEAAKPWEDYEREAAALVDKYWPMIEAVAARLMKVDYVTGHEVDTICARVARQEHAKKLRNR